MQLQWLDLDPVDNGAARFLVLVREGAQLGLGEIAAPTGAKAAIVQLIGACAARLADASPHSLSLLIEAISQVTDQEAQLGPAVRAAIDTALHDLTGKLRGCAVHTILGGSYRHTVALSRRVSHAAALPSNKDETVALRLQYLREPSRHATGFGPSAAGSWIAAVLASSATAVQLDIDAEGQFDNPALARIFVEGLLASRPRINLGLLQPLDENDLIGHALLCATLPVPVILDSSVRSPRLMAQIVRLRAADRIVLNLDRVGGLRAAMQVVSLAEAAAVGVSSATTARTAVGAAAALHLAAALHDTFPAQLDAFDADHPAIAAAAFTIDRAAARLGSAPGLGVVLTDAALAAFQPAA
jgi:L-alanine-DL-glutamate epimerase-like enolase superfamily enzyme